MEQHVLKSLNALGYDGPLLDKASLQEALNIGPKSVEYTQLVNFLTTELRPLLNIDEEVNVIASAEDSTTFIMEVSSFLKELNCPYTSLTQGHISERLQSLPDRIILLDYLASELMSGRILQEKKPDKKIELKLKETEEAAAMKKILTTLRFPKPPPNLTIETLFQKLQPSLQTHINKASKELIGNPAFSGKLSDKQWEILNGVQKDLNNEYKIRREMLLTRLDVTIQSFQWSDRTKGKDDLFEKVYSEKRRLLKTDPNVDISDLLAARDDIAIIEKTSSSNVRKNTRSSLNKVIIGQVPDRGGRTSEQAPPPPEMPSWQQRTAGPQGGGGRGGRGGGGGGRGGGNYSRGDYQNTSHQNFSRGNDSFNKTSSFNSGGGFDSAGSYGGNKQYTDNSFNRSTTSSGGYNQQQGGRSYDSGNTYSQGRNYDSTSSYNQGRRDSGGSYSQGARDNTASDNQGRRDSGGSYNQSGSYGQGGRDSAGSYGQTRSFDSAGSYGRNFDSAGSYGGKSIGSNSYTSGTSYGSATGGSYGATTGGSYGATTGGYGGSNYSKGYDDTRRTSYDSAGTFGKESQYEQNSKRVKTYDSFQSNRTTYADQYVKEDQQNQQYRNRGGNQNNRGGGGGGGRSNYNRGGSGGGRRY